LGGTGAGATPGGAKGHRLASRAVVLNVPPPSAPQPFGTTGSWLSHSIERADHATSEPRAPLPHLTGCDRLAHRLTGRDPSASAGFARRPAPGRHGLAAQASLGPKRRLAHDRSSRGILARLRGVSREVVSIPPSRSGATRNPSSAVPGWYPSGKVLEPGSKHRFISPINSDHYAGAPGGTRTPNRLIRSQVLYPLSYRRAPKPPCTIHRESSTSRHSVRTGRRRFLLVDANQCGPWWGRYTW
jgi:hypothetical protein